MIVFFFFKQKTAYEIKECDWSSDVCSSDLDLYVNELSDDKFVDDGVIINVEGQVFSLLGNERDRKSVV